jgi:uncharacterized protein (TIGR03435 family)
MALRAFILAANAACLLAALASAQEKLSVPASTPPTSTAPTPPASTNSAKAASPANSVVVADPAAFSYEVVSIKPYKQSDAGMSMSWRSTEDGFSAQGTSLKQLLFNTFPIIMGDQLVGLPPWADSEYYYIDAKMDEGTAAAFDKLSRDQKNEIRYSMMQAAMADRFQLKFHKETRELPVYNLVVAKGGIKIQPTPEGKGNGYSMSMGKLNGNGIELDILAFSLSGEVGRMIVNKTGLTGRYTIDLKWQPDAMAAGSANSSSAEPPLPDLFVALQEQLGLKLESTKGPVDVYVIDHVERPSEN